jgi:hypothetical protein
MLVPLGRLSLAPGAQRLDPSMHMTLTSGGM